MNFLITKDKDMAINPYRVDEIRIMGNRIVAGIHGSYSGSDMVTLGNYETPEITREVFGRLLSTLANISDYSCDGIIDMGFIEKEFLCEEKKNVTGKEKLARKEYETVGTIGKPIDLEELFRKPTEKEEVFAADTIRHNIDSFTR